MKIILGIVIVSLGTAMGVLFSAKYVKRKEFYEAFDTFNKKIITNVSFVQDTLPSIVKEYKNCDNDFCNTIYKYFVLKEMEDGSIKYLSKDENSFFENYMASVGKSDRDSQISFLNSCAKRIEENLSDAQKNEKRYRVASIKLGFFFGLLLFVIIL